MDEDDPIVILENAREIGSLDAEERKYVRKNRKIDDDDSDDDGSCAIERERRRG